MRKHDACEQKCGVGEGWVFKSRQDGRIGPAVKLEGISRIGRHHSTLT